MADPTYTAVAGTNNITVTQTVETVVDKNIKMGQLTQEKNNNLAQISTLTTRNTAIDALISDIAAL